MVDIHSSCFINNYYDISYRRLLDYNQAKMPFAAAQIGLGFRNEIAPRNGLLRVREFCMAEIEHFVDPKDKKHPKFRRVRDTEVTLFPGEAQMTTGRTLRTTIGQAVDSGLINNETLGYFMARTQLWLQKIGVDPKRMRFRQHLKTEMAHYACDCWDMEIHMSYGWTECVGHADRSCYDLEQHSHKTGIPLLASARLAEPIVVDKVIAEPNKRLIGPRFKGEQKAVIALLEGLEGDALEQFQQCLQSQGSCTLDKFTITSDLVSFKSEKKTVVDVKFTPSVIEPSYGVGRILYAVMEHAFSQREGDEQRCVMSFRPCVAPIKVGIFRLINNAAFDPIVDQIHEALQCFNISNKVDSSSGSVGRRYARADELGIPFGVTVDFDTLLDDAVTLRERDSMAQVRIPIRKLLDIMPQLVSERMSWEDVLARYPKVLAAPEEDEEDSNNNSAGKKEDAKGASTSLSALPIVLEKTPRGSFSRPNPLYKASA